MNASGCLTAYRGPGTLITRVTPQAECANDIALVESVDLQRLMRSATPCPSTGEVLALVLGSGESLKKDIAGCSDTPYADVRAAVSELKAEMLASASVDAAGD